jgi:mRNA-binding protein PUF3
MKPQLLALKKYNYGKQIAAIEKLIFTGAQPSHQSQLPSYASNINMVPSTVSKTLPLDINSSVPTPMLTMEQNSPQSSSLPSTNASTVDGPTESASSKAMIGKAVMPEVRIETV